MPIINFSEVSETYTPILCASDQFNSDTSSHTIISAVVNTQYEITSLIISSESNCEVYIDGGTGFYMNLALQARTPTVINFGNDKPRTNVNTALAITSARDGLRTYSTVFYRIIEV